MSFLTATPELTETCFTAEHLAIAQRNTRLILERFYSGWIEHPQGFIAKRWESDALQDVCYLLEIARIFDNLYNIFDQRAKGILTGKFCNLFAAKGKIQFDPILTEFQVADFLNKCMLKIEYEPDVARRSGATGKPDFSILLQGKKVFVEATSLRSLALTEWESAIKKSENLLTSAFGFDTGIILNLEFPLEERQRPFNERDIKQIVPLVMGAPEGSLKRESLSGKPIQVFWHKVEIKDRKDPDKAEVFAKLNNNLIEVQAVSTGFGATILGNLPTTIATDLLSNSIMNRLKKKLRQFDHEAPYLVCISSNHNYEFDQAILDLATQRLWPNPLYRRLSGVLLLYPRLNFAADQQTDRPYMIRSLNPNATNPIPNDLKAVMNFA